MYISTVVLILLVLFFVWRGYQKGFFHAITRIISLVSAYAAALYFTKPLARLIFKYTSLDGLIVYFIAGGLVFLLASFIVAQLIQFLSRSMPDEIHTNLPSRIGGAVIGLLVGVLTGLLMDYAINLWQTPLVVTSGAVSGGHIEDTRSGKSLRDGGVSQLAAEDNKPESAVPVTDALIDAGAKKMVSAVTAKAMDLTMDDPVATQLSKDFAANPQDTVNHIKHLSTDKEISTLLGDREVQGLLKNGDVDALLDNDKFQELLDNEHMQAIFSNTGDEDSGKGSQQVAAETIVKFWKRADAVQHDPRVTAILADPDFQKHLSSGNHAALLMDRKFKQLTEIIVSNDTRPPQEPIDRDVTNERGVATEKFSNKNKSKKSNTRIFKWTDENGVVHYEDKPAPATDGQR